jgi:hypothetical protein
MAFSIFREIRLSLLVGVIIAIIATFFAKVIIAIS